MPSLADSLKNGIHPLEEEKYKERFESKVDKYRSDSILSIADFRALGKNYQGTIKEDVNLNDQFCITYTSGSTNAKHPKQIIHNVRSFIMIARHHDKDMSGGVDMSKLTLLSHIPPYSNTDIISSISDSLMQGSKLALEPIYDRNFFLTSLRINEPNCVIATTSFWIQAMKDAMYKPENKDLLMPYLLIIFAAGEGMSANEEKFLNRGLRKVRAGSKFLPPFLKSTVMSAGGGDCVHCSIFYSILRLLFERKNSDGNIEEAG